MSRTTAGRTDARDGFGDVLAELAQSPHLSASSRQSRSSSRWSASSAASAVGREWVGSDNGIEDADVIFTRGPADARGAGSRGEGPLSYEQALRRHARVDVEFDVEEMLNSASEQAAPLSPPAEPASRSIREKEAEAVAKPGRRSTRDAVRPASGSHVSETAVTMPSSAAPSVPRRKSAARKASVVTAPVATEPEALTVSALMAERERAARRTKLTTEKPSPGTVDQDEQKTASIALARKSVALQRRTVVSVRLTAEEVEQLRARAEESGVSVSEYMRSCVMDAEKLRTQVRQVITDMRSLGAVSLVRQHNVLQAGDSEMPRNKDWLRTLWRSAGYLLHPFGLLRRSA